MTTPTLTLLAVALALQPVPAPAPPDAPAPEPAPLPLAQYEPQTLAGFRVLVHPEAPADALRFRRCRAALLVDLETIAARVPAPALAVLRESPIVISPTTPARPPFTGRGMCFHESAGWLTASGFDAAREGAVEICNIDDFLLWRAEQPMMTLHEFAHAYHWRIGFGRADVAAAYRAARNAGRYDAVAYALAPDGQTRPAYALVNEKEYFAELTEACFGRNDYFPFTRDELRSHDPEGFDVINRLWKLAPDEITRERSHSP